MSERNGRLHVDGDRAVLNFERRLPFPIEVVWSAITDPAERSSGSARQPSTAAKAAPSTWSRPVHQYPQTCKRMTGRILVWDPPHVLEHEWKQPIVEDGVVRYELTADGDGATLLRFTHRGLRVRNAAGSAAAPRPSWIGWSPPRRHELPVWTNRVVKKSCLTSHFDIRFAAASRSPTTPASGTPRRSPHAVAAGARDAGADVTLIAVNEMTDADSDTLDAADAIVLGTADLHGQRVRRRSRRSPKRPAGGATRQPGATRSRRGSPTPAPRAVTS